MRQLNAEHVPLRLLRDTIMMLIVLVVLLHVIMELKGASESGWGGNHRLSHRSWGQVDKGGGQGLDHAKT